MHLTSFQRIALPTLISTLFLAPPVEYPAAGTEDLPRGHSKFTTIVTKKAGALVVTTPNGATSRAGAFQSGGGSDCGVG